MKLNLNLSISTPYKSSLGTPHQLEQPTGPGKEESNY